MTRIISRYSFLPPVLIFLASLPIKLLAAQSGMPFDIDLVPVLSRGIEYALPPVGTLSSVAAYNMPALQWLHLPALRLTHDAGLSMLLTMLAVNAIAIGAIYALAAALFDRKAGWIAAALFAFSETGISSAYTAWAQLLLPGYAALVLLCLWYWIEHERGIFLALAGMLATLAWMTHFSAVLLFPAMLIVALLARARWQWRWLLIGATACLLLLTPYLLFEAQRDFADLRAFFSQRTLASPEALRSAEAFKPEAGQAAIQQDSPAPAQQPRQPDNVVQRVLNYARTLPAGIFTALHINFVSASSTRGLRAIDPTAGGLAQVFLLLPVIASAAGAAFAGWNWLRLPSAERDLRRTDSGRMLLLSAFLAALLLGFVLTRTLNDTTYLMSLQSVQIVLAAGLLRQIAAGRRGAALVVLLTLAFALTGITERLARIGSHDDTRFSPYNVSLYRHIRAAADFIAQDWQGRDTLTISYDLLPEMPDLWWVVAWNSVDRGYRMGMNFDFLLALHHGLSNRNQSAEGRMEGADYSVVYLPGLVRYDPAAYQIHTFGAIAVLKDASP